MYGIVLQKRIDYEDLPLILQLFIDFMKNGKNDYTMVNKEQILLRISEEEIFKRYTGKS